MGVSVLTRRWASRLARLWRCLWLLPAVVVLAACGAATGGTTTPPSAVKVIQRAAGSCAKSSRSEQFASARFVFDAVMLPGPSVAAGRSRLLASPAHVRVVQYRKGHGPARLNVQTALARRSDGSIVGREDALEARAGQRWRVYADDLNQPVDASVCAGTRQIWARAAKTRRFTGDGLRFRYPAAWRTRRDFPASTFQIPLVALSPQPLRTPCVRRRDRYGNSTVSCRQPLTRLRPGSLLAIWSINARPGWQFKQVPGTPRIVGGRPAKILITHHDCHIGARRLIDVVIPLRRQTDGWYELVACVRGPNILRQQRIIRDLLHSTTTSH